MFNFANLRASSLAERPHIASENGPRKASRASSASGAVESKKELEQKRRASALSPGPEQKKEGAPRGRPGGF